MIRICYNPITQAFCIGNLKTKKAPTSWCTQYTTAIKEYHNYSMDTRAHSIFTNYKSYIYIDIDESFNLYDVPKIFPELFL